MELELFVSRLRETAARARDFGQTFIEESLPDPVLFRVRLNGSYDGHPRVGDEVVFPEDGTFERTEQLKLCTERRVIDELWRKGRIPEWIDVCVIGETGDATVLQLMCCGRFTADDSLLYHTQEGRPPFHITGPSLPYGHESGQKFSVYHEAECWSLHDLQRLRGNAHKVWALRLVGSWLDDQSLSDLPDLSRLEILELRATSTTSSGLSQVSRLPKLRILRIHRARHQAVTGPELRALLPSIKIVEVHEVSADTWST